MKKLVFLLSIICICLTIPTKANTLIKDDKGYKLEDEDGNYFVNCWQLVDHTGAGVYYNSYFGSDGYMYTNAITPDGQIVNEIGQLLVNGIPMPYIFNLERKTNNTTKYVIEIGNTYDEAIYLLTYYGIQYTVPLENTILYYDKEGKAHVYYFNANKKCIVDVEAMVCDLNASNYLLVEKLKNVRLPLVSSYKTDTVEFYTYAQEYKDTMYGRQIQKTQNNNTWWTFLDMIFDVKIEDAIEIMNKMSQYIK